MRILIDTHIFLFLLSKPEVLGRERLSLLEDVANDICLSSVSIAELMIKSSTGKIRIDFNPIFCAKEAKLKLIDFTAEEAILLKDLPFLHKDPFDRMLICQSIYNDLYLMTDDEKFKQYKCKIL